MGAAPDRAQRGTCGVKSGRLLFCLTMQLKGRRLLLLQEQGEDVDHAGHRASGGLLFVQRAHCTRAAHVLTMPCEHAWLASPCSSRAAACCCCKSRGGRGEGSWGVRRKEALGVRWTGARAVGREGVGGRSIQHSKGVGSCCGGAASTTVAGWGGVRGVRSRDPGALALRSPPTHSCNNHKL